MWRNWARDQTCAPAETARPSARDEVVAAVTRAAAAGRRVRAVGSGHSFTDVALTDGMMLDLSAMRRVLDADRASGLVRVEAGITIHALSRELAAHGLALANLGDVDAQTIAGATATATHGTGARLANLSSQIAAIELVTAGGDVLELDASTDPDGWRAARVGIGSLGVVTAMTLRCVPAFRLRGVDAPAPLEETLDRLDELADANDHFEFFSFPHTGIALTRTNNRTEDAATPRSRLGAWASDILLGNHVFEALLRIGRARPTLIPAINRFATRAAGASTRVGASHEIFASPRLVRFVEMEYAVPREHAARAVRTVNALIEERGFDVSFPLELRFAAGDDALLSPAHERDSAYVAVHVYRGMAWEPFFRAVEAEMDALGGRPHWGKRHFQTAATLAAKYPQWDRFAQVRARLDPHGTFASAFTERVLGPVAG